MPGSRKNLWAQLLWTAALGVLVIAAAPQLTQRPPPAGKVLRRTLSLYGGLRGAAEYNSGSAAGQILWTGSYPLTERFTAWRSGPRLRVDVSPGTEEFYETFCSTPDGCWREMDGVADTEGKDLDCYLAGFGLRTLLMRAASPDAHVENLGRCTLPDGSQAWQIRCFQDEVSADLYIDPTTASVAALRCWGDLGAADSSTRFYRFLYPSQDSLPSACYGWNCYDGSELVAHQWLA